MFGITINPTAMSASDQMASMGMVTTKLAAGKEPLKELRFLPKQIFHTGPVL